MYIVNLGLPSQRRKNSTEIMSSIFPPIKNSKDLMMDYLYSILKDIMITSKFLDKNVISKMFKGIHRNNKKKLNKTYM